MEDILKALQQPEYVHVVLNHLPIIGLMAGLLVLLIAIFQKNRPTSIAAYLVILLMSLSVFPVSEFGEKAVDRVEGLLDADGHTWLHEHEERAEKVSAIYYLAAAAAVGGLLIPRFAPKTAPIFLYGTLLLGAVALVGGIWAASAGGKVLHREFRYSPPPSVQATEN